MFLFGCKVSNYALKKQISPTFSFGLTIFNFILTGPSDSPAEEGWPHKIVITVLRYNVISKGG